MNTNENQAADCQRVSASLSAYHDGRTRNSAAIREHLASCSSCSRELAIVAQLSDLAAELPLLEPRPGLAGRVRERLELGQVRPVGGNLMPAALAASVLVLGCLWAAFYVGHKRGLAEGERLEVANEFNGSNGASESYGSSESSSHELGNPEPKLRNVAMTAEPQGLAAVGERAVDPKSASPKQPALTPVPEPASLAAIPMTQADRDAVRAARSVFADLALLDSVPADLRKPMMASQVQYFGLDQWADSVFAGGDRHPAAGVANLVMGLEQAIERGLPQADLVSLSTSAAAPSFWDTGESLVLVPARADGRGDIERTMAAFASGASPDARDSLRSWLLFKEDLLQNGGDIEAMLGLLDALGTSGMGGRSGGIALPNLGELLDEIQWTEEADGGRSGKLEVEHVGESGTSSYRLEVHISGGGSGGGYTSKSSTFSSSSTQGTRED